MEVQSVQYKERLGYKIRTIPKSRKGVSPPQGTILSGFHHVPYGIS